MPSDLILEVEGRRQVFLPGNTYLIGRAPECDVMVRSGFASRHHLQVFQGTDGNWYGRDLETLNGTFVGGSPAPAREPFPLLPGAMFLLGDPQQGAGCVVPHDQGPAHGVAMGSTALAVMQDSAVTDAHETDRLIALPPGAALSVGRAPDNDIILVDPMVSGHHARIISQGGAWAVEDLGSTNGTFVNGARITSGVAHVGDTISIERLFLRVEPGGLRQVATTGISSAPEGATSVRVSHVTFTVPDGKGGRKALLDDVSFDIPRNSLLAVIGPSGAGKSTILKAMTGALTPDQGEVTFNGLPMATFAKSLAHQIGVVPQDDLVHTELTGTRCLSYAAELRFPPSTPKAERDSAVGWAIHELGLEPHAGIPIKRMSGGQRKRVSTAMELLTRPELLFLDEPTSGLDPHLDLEVMQMLRRLAHGEGGGPGRTVVVITHSTANLGLADNVLLLAPGGKVAYFGPPDQLIGFFEETIGRPHIQYSDVYQAIAGHPDTAKQLFAARHPVPPMAPPAPQRELPAMPKRRYPFLHQSATLLRRQLRLTMADTSLMLFLAALPVVIGALTLTIGAKWGFNPADATKSIGHPRMLLLVLVFGASLMGIVPSVRQIVGERPIYARETAAGVRPSAYLWSKLAVLGLITAVQSVILVLVALLLNQHPARGVWGPLWLELSLVVFAVAWTSAALGLLLSAAVRTSEQVMPLMIVVLMLQLLLSGGVISLSAPLTNAVSKTAPSRWGFAAGASSLDINRVVTCQSEILTKRTMDDEINKQARKSADETNKKAADDAKAKGLPAPPPVKPDEVHTQVDCAKVEDQDRLWTHSTGQWATNMGVLGGMLALCTVAAYFVLRRGSRRS